MLERRRAPTPISELFSADAELRIAELVRERDEARAALAALARRDAPDGQMQRLESVGKLAGGIVHDFNNLLSVVTSYATFLLEDLPKDAPCRSDVEEIAAASRRATSLTSQLLAFSRREELPVRPLDLNAIVLDMERLFGRTVGEDVDLVLALDPELGRAMADTSQIEQVLMNLVVNARDAMPEGGKLTLGTRNVRSGGQDFVALSVTDSGCGMDARTIARASEPFFTTKARGTGLGLATVHRIAEAHGGRVEVTSARGAGTKMEIFLPLADEGRAAFATEAAPAPQVRGSETVLVVEDEEVVRRAMHASLSRKGYEVLEASSGDEALRICEAHAGPIDVLVTDVVMPHMNGTTLADRAASIRPLMRVVYVSGHTGLVLRGAGSSDGFLQKPFSPDALARKVREAMDGVLHRR